MGCIAIGTLYTIATADGRQGASMYGGFHEYVKAVAETEARVVSLLLGYQENATERNGQNASEYHLLVSDVAVAMISVTLNWLGSMSWCGAMTMNTLWALMFWLLLREVFLFVNRCSSRNTLDVRGTIFTTLIPNLNS